jgi:hypothetical protein
MSKFFRIVTIAAAVCLTSACIKAPAQPGAPTAPAEASTGVWQATSIPGTGSTAAGVLRVNVTTGATWIYTGAGTTFFQIPDLSIPAGEYHLQLWSQPSINGSGFVWGAMRFDKVSGRVWLITGGGSTWNWQEITNPK